MKTQVSPSPAVLTRHVAQKSSFLSVQLLQAARVLCVLAGVLGLSRTVQAQIEPALPGSIEYGLITNNYTWVRTSAPITAGIYVEDLLTGRLGQPVGRGDIGIVTGTSWDADYNEMAAMVDFGRDYSVGIVFPELSAIQLIPVPEPSSLGILVLGVTLGRAVLRRSRRLIA